MFKNWFAVVGVLVGFAMWGCAGSNSGGDGSNTTLNDSNNEGGPEICPVTGVGRIAGQAQIFGGQEVEDRDPISKSVVGILKFQGERFICTGVIISPDTILTAAHCVNGAPEDFKIIFARSMVSPSCADQSQLREVSALLPHEGYRLKEKIFNSNDIALIKIKGGLPLGFTPAKFLEDYSQVRNDDIVVAGFGVSSTSQHDYGVMKRSLVRRISKLDGPSGVQDLSWNRPALLFDQSHGSGVCSGDSGGGAFLKIESEYRLIGIASIVANSEGSEPCAGISGHMNTRIYRAWIQAGITKLHSDLK